MPQCFGTDIEGPGSDLSLHGSSLIDRAKPGHPLTSTLSMTDSTGRTLQLYNCSVPHYFSEVWPLFSGFIWFYMVLCHRMHHMSTHELSHRPGAVPSPSPHPAVPAGRPAMAMLRDASDKASVNGHQIRGNIENEWKNHQLILGIFWQEWLFYVILVIFWKKTDFD